MSKNTMVRLARLETASASRFSKRISVAADREEADALRAQHRTALVIITGVPRGPENRR